MAKAVHITTARKMIDSGDPVDLKVWAKDGRMLHLQNCIGLRYNFRSGTRQVKLLTSRQIRTIRDVLMFEINGLTIYL
ncbi:MAG: hypothetical protein IJ160_07860 [Muribaculaceae bacterium]|nr:hypothetical protein [Muribaculaceae bacterium]